LTDNDLIKIFMPIIDNGLADQLIEAEVISSYQPSKQGVPTGKTVFFGKVGGDKIIGTPKRTSVYNALTGTTDDIDYQRVESTWQIGALVKQNASEESITASDLANIVQQILCSTYSIEILTNNGIGILRVTNVRNPFFEDDRGQYEASPSFDFTLVYDRVITIKGKIFNDFEVELKRV